MTPRQLLDGLRAGAQHRGGVRCLKLSQMHPAAFANLRAEVLRLCAQNSPSTVTSQGHITAWVLPYGEILQYSLFNASGRADDFTADHDLSRADKRFTHARECPALADLVGLLPDLVNLRIAVLGPGAGLSPHEEQVFVRAPDRLVVPRVRFHLPVETARTASLILDDDVFWLEAGHVYLVNHGCVHAAHNAGRQPRVHLVWDQVLTAEAFEVMFGDGPPPRTLIRVPDNERIAPVLRRQRLGAARRLPPQVSEADVAAAGLAQPGWQGRADRSQGAPATPR